MQRDQAVLALSQAQAQLAMAEAAVHEGEKAEEYATIRAPFAGTVVARYVDAGDLASPGVPLLLFQSEGQPDVVLAVPADVAANLRAGDTLTVTAPDDRRAPAPVPAIPSGADSRAGTVGVRGAGGRGVSVRLAPLCLPGHAALRVRRPPLDQLRPAAGDRSGPDL